jgi:hypothetical protein
MFTAIKQNSRCMAWGRAMGAICAADPTENASELQELEEAPGKSETSKKKAHGLKAVYSWTVDEVVYSWTVFALEAVPLIGLLAGGAQPWDGHTMSAVATYFYFFIMACDVISWIWQVRGLALFALHGQLLVAPVALTPFCLNCAGPLHAGNVLPFCNHGDATTSASTKARVPCKNAGDAEIAPLALAVATVAHPCISIQNCRGATGRGHTTRPRSRARSCACSRARSRARSR